MLSLKKHTWFTLTDRRLRSNNVYCTNLQERKQVRGVQFSTNVKQIKNQRLNSLIMNVSSDTLSRTQSEKGESVIISPQNFWQRFQPSPRVRGLILLNILTLLMASNWVVVKESEVGFDPFTFAMLRFGVASLALTPFVQKAFSNRRLWKAGAELGFWSAVGYMTQAVGLMETDASRASLISTLTVILVPVMAGLSGRGVKPLTWGAGIMALLGVSMLEGGGGHPPNMGDFWSLISAVGFALQIFRTEAICRGYCGKYVMQLLSIAVFVTFFFSAATASVMHPEGVLAALNCIAHGTLSSGNLMDLIQQCPGKEILYTGLLTTDAVLLIEMFALHDVSSVEAAIIYTMEPVLGAALAYCFLGERWGPLGWIGAALILGSSLAAQVFGENEEEKQQLEEGLHKPINE
eukprot:TRINITY_DN1071_c0_g2_i2.p1 TRINITY_DN1071_c0_g2~~TRINITY_DN1071_c0_g2_i2.p1  ORF type:complete len:438 (-),score=50.25 TRINITY_DN1071_c0_g2_i2:1407-2624(-)